MQSWIISFNYYLYSISYPDAQIPHSALELPEAGWKEADGTKDDLADHVVSTLVDHRMMLDEYFSFQIETIGRTSWRQNICMCNFLDVDVDNVILTDKTNNC